MAQTDNEKRAKSRAYYLANKSRWKEYREKITPEMKHAYYIANKQKWNESSVKNRAKILENQRKRYAANPEIRVKQRNYRTEHQEQYNRLNKESNAKNPIPNRVRAKAWRINNPEKYAKQLQEWRDKNHDHVNSYVRNKRKSDINFKLKTGLRSRLSSLLRGKKWCSYIELLGCPLEEFRVRLESKFKSGMSWNNYGRQGWHIDHIRPCASFDLTDPEQQKICFHFSNLQPLWAIDNMRKGDRYLE